MLSRRINNSAQNAGFTLVELLVALVLGLVIIGTVLSVFISSKASYLNNERAARLQENGRIGLYYLSEDLRHANFWGPLLNTETDQLSFSAISGQVSGACASWIENASNAFIGSTDALADATLSCLGSGNVKANTSTVAIKRVSGQPVSYDFTTSSQNGRLFLRANSTGGQMLIKGSGASAPPADNSLTDWAYRPVLYFVRPFTVTAADALPSLCAKHLITQSGTPTLQTECLVEGVEELHIEYGIDNDGNGVPEGYQTTPNRDAMTAKVYLLVRDRDADYSYHNQKTYQLGSRSVGPFNDNYHRALFSTTVIIHNQRLLPLK